jgi:Na+/alanine symporter
MIAIIVFLLFFGFLVFWFILSSVIFYHLRRFDYKNGIAGVVQAVYAVISLIIILITGVVALNSNWEFQDAFNGFRLF